MRHQLNARVFYQLDMAMSDNAVSSHTFFRLWQYICDQIMELEHPLRHAESVLWKSRAEELVRLMLSILLAGLIRWCYFVDNVP